MFSTIQYNMVMAFCWIVIYLFFASCMFEKVNCSVVFFFRQEVGTRNHSVLSLLR